MVSAVSAKALPKFWIAVSVSAFIVLSSVALLEHVFLVQA